MDEEPATDKATEKLDRARTVYEDHGRLFKILWVAVGAIVVAVGLALMVLPGPGMVVLTAGLIMLATAFGWARRLLDSSVRGGVEAIKRAEAAGPWTKALAGLAAVCVAAAVVALIVL